MPKSAKRSAQTTCGEVAKTPKLDPCVAGVIEALQQANIPEHCRSMLVAMSPSCFTVEDGKAHESQVKVASWIQEVLEDEKATLQQALDETDKEAATVKAKADELQTQVDQIHLRLQEVKQAASVPKETEERTADASAGGSEAAEAQKDGEEAKDADAICKENSEKAEGEGTGAEPASGTSKAEGEAEDSEALHRQLVTELGAAQAALDAISGSQGALSETRQKKSDQLQNFTGYHMECFNMVMNKLAAAGA